MALPTREVFVMRYYLFFWWPVLLGVAAVIALLIAHQWWWALGTGVGAAVVSVAWLFLVCTHFPV